MTRPSDKTSHTPQEDAASIPGFYGENVFSIRTMREALSEAAYKSLMATIREGRSLDAGIADEVAEAMKDWAVSRGATHFTHWFQPLTGTTAEKHDSFIFPDQDGGVLLRFSGKELIMGEPDASSLPSGGLRATFEARGYTAWDPTSPAFLKEGVSGATLCVPTVFFAYHGEALDKKTPLLRSIEVLSKQLDRLAALFGVESAGGRSVPELGIEQEYFLVDRSFFDGRLDLLQTGRTLFGKAPAKHQQMEDHYIGAIRPRVLAFMEDLDHTLWRYGIPARTRHNEVCPGQYEVAPVFEELNLAVDHNMLLMQLIREIAGRHDFACLLHEKPFAGVNGSGKHNNWGVRGPDGKNWLKPGENPHEDAKFLTLICAIIKAIDTYPELLRASVANAGNDHRLGANEAPPAIMSVFLGDQLTEVLQRIEQGTEQSPREGGILNLGLASLPRLPKDATDRNRTSPFAFTGNKFEFRAPGADQSCADPNTMLNTIVADAVDGICTDLETALAAERDFDDALQEILRVIVRKHKRVIFNGDNYTEEWRREAATRGLPDIRTTPDALEALISEKAIALFEKHAVLSRRELESRHEVYRKEYEAILRIEAECAATMVRTMIMPAATQHATRLSAYVNGLSSAGLGDEVAASRGLLRVITGLCEDLLGTVEAMERMPEDSAAADTIAAMRKLRECVDRLEGLVSDELWPLPSYADMMFMM
ncbi:MAG: glutamine synthetase III [Lentisphaerae bacterium]|nr:glutamine synthetase III [Lentisphaerota bacterium]